MVKHIIIGSGLQNVLGLIRSLGREGCRSILILEPCALDECSARFSRYLDQVYCLKHENELIDLLLSKFGSDTERPIVYTTSDSSAALIDENYNRLKSRFITFNANATQGGVSQYIDKSHSFPLAEECGMNVIRSWKILPNDDIPTEIPFPCLVKGNRSVETSKADMAVCYNRDELLAHRRPDISYLIQPFLKKEYELDIVCLSLDHGNHIIIPAVVRKIREELYRQSDYIRLDAVSDYPKLNLDAMRRFIRAIGYEGLCSIEFLYAQDKYFFLEINLRNDGTCYLYTAGGVNLPYLWSVYAQKRMSDVGSLQFKCKTPMSLMQIYDIYNLFARRVSFFRWVDEWVRVRACFVFSLIDPLPALHATYIHMRQVVRKICGSSAGL